MGNGNGQERNINISRSLLGVVRWPPQFEWTVHPSPSICSSSYMGVTNRFCFFSSEICIYDLVLRKYWKGEGGQGGNRNSGGIKSLYLIACCSIPGISSALSSAPTSGGPPPPGSLEDNPPSSHQEIHQPASQGASWERRASRNFNCSACFFVSLVYWISTDF